MRQRRQNYDNHVREWEGGERDDWVGDMKRMVYTTWREIWVHVTRSFRVAVFTRRTMYTKH
jgi:hypothetical protein